MLHAAVGGSTVHYIRVQQIWQQEERLPTTTKKRQRARGAVRSYGWFRWIDINPTACEFIGEAGFIHQL